MNRIARARRVKSMPLAFVGLFISLINVSLLAQANESSGFSPADGTGNGSPTTTRPALPMGPCDIKGAGELPLILVPKDQGWITTTEAYPTFWFYSSVPLNQFASVEFELKGASPRKTFRRSLSQTTPSSGVMSIHLPETEAQMEINQTYQWKLIFICPGGRTVLTVRNNATRVSPSPELTRSLMAGKTPEAKAAAYAQHGVWLDALTLLGDRRRADPSNAVLTTQWTELLEDDDVALQEDLPDIATKPIVDSVQFATNE
jgi:hypothetical protein